MSEIRQRYKYLKHKILKTNRYLLTSRIVSFLENANVETPPVGIERKVLLKFLRRHVASMFNYPYILKYHYRRVKVSRDKATGLHYVLTNENRRLYFKRDMKIAHIRTLYNNLCSEQDEQSPHNYCFHDFSINSDSVFADVGAAEGMFTLKFIDKIKTAYLFECDKDWVEALQSTFQPWSEKVIIVDKYVADKDSDEFASLDYFFCEREKPTLIKIDVEGAESDVLKGAGKLLNEGINDLLVCTYHKRDDERNLSEQLRKKGYKSVPSPGYMLMISDNSDSSNDTAEGSFDFRRGLIHAKKDL